MSKHRAAWSGAGRPAAMERLWSVYCEHHFEICPLRTASGRFCVSSMSQLHSSIPRIQPACDCTRSWIRTPSRAGRDCDGLTDCVCHVSARIVARTNRAQRSMEVLKLKRPGEVLECSLTKINVRGVVFRHGFWSRRLCQMASIEKFTSGLHTAARKLYSHQHD